MTDDRVAQLRSDEHLDLVTSLQALLPPCPTCRGTREVPADCPVCSRYTVPEGEVCGGCQDLADDCPTCAGQERQMIQMAWIIAAWRRARWTVYFVTTDPEWFDEAGAFASARDAAIHWAANQGVDDGELFVSHSPGPNPDFDPDEEEDDVDNRRTLLMGDTRVFTFDEEGALDDGRLYT